MGFGYFGDGIGDGVGDLMIPSLIFPIFCLSWAQLALFFSLHFFIQVITCQRFHVFYLYNSCAGFAIAIALKTLIKS
jgi:hypothetical protein